MRDQKFKILMVSDNYYPHPGGISEHIYHLSAELRKRGHEVHILTSKYAENSIGQGEGENVIRVGLGIRIPVNKSFSSINISPLVIKEVRNVLERENYDIVHIHGSLAPTLPLVTLQYSNAINFITFHSAHDDSLGYEIFRPLLLRRFKKLKGLIAVSEVARDSVIKYFPGNYRIIPNGVDPVRFSPDVEPFPDLVEEGWINLLFVGRLEPRKGLRYLLKAMPKIVKEFPKTRLLIVGSGPLKKWYQKFIKDEIKDRIYFVGVSPPEKLPRYYASSHIFISPATQGESFGIVLLEAMATGIPIIASDIPGYRQVMEDGKEGFFVPPENPEEIANATIQLLENNELRKEMGRKGREKVLMCYSWEKISQMVEDYYYEVFNS